MEMRGEKSYYDSSNGFWWSYGWDGWSFSIDGGSTWKETPSLEIQVVEDSSLDDYVGVFDGKEWSQAKGRLEFLDQDYAMAGWLGMDQFFYDLYDGVGYDGEPLRLTYQEVYDDGGDERSDRWDHLPYSGHEINDTTVGSGNVKEVTLKVYGDWTDCLKASFSIPNPTQDFRDRSSTEHMNVYMVSHDAFDEYGKDSRSSDEWKFIHEALGENVITGWYYGHAYSLERLVGDLETIQYVYNQTRTGDQEILIENLAIDQHAAAGRFMVGMSDVNPHDVAKPWPFDSLGIGYEDEFERLNVIMKDGGQIQHYGCKIASFNPHSAAANSDNLEEPASKEYAALSARRMLSSIAKLSGTFVYASSDGQYLDVERSDEREELVVIDAECCLEFGVSPAGMSVDYTTCSQKIWNLKRWLPEELHPTQVPGSVQTLWDTDEPYELRKGVYVATEGEPGGDFYRPFFLTG